MIADYVAYRNLFIQILVKVFEDFAHTEHLAELHIKVSITFIYLVCCFLFPRHTGTFAAYWAVQIMTVELLGLRF